MGDPFELRLRRFRTTRSYESLLWGVRALVVLPAASVLLPFAYAAFPEPVSVVWIVAILSFNWLFALFLLGYGLRGLDGLRRACLQRRGDTLKAVVPMLKQDLLDFTR